MACLLIPGAAHLSGEIDDDGARTYKIKFKVVSDATDGPANVMQTPGLPLPGTTWLFRGDVDVWAWCRPTMTVAFHPECADDEFPTIWLVEQTFSTKPPSKEQAQRKRCADERIEDPLLEPDKISGQSVQYQEQTAFDRYAQRIETSARELIRGPQVEFDAHRHRITVVQNVVNLQHATISAMLDTLNDRTLWGYAKRFVKLSDFSWERKYYGGCYQYYTRTLVFDIFPRYEADTPGDTSTTYSLVSGFDRKIPDEGTMCLRGQWERNPNLATYGTWRRGTQSFLGIPTELDNVNAGPGDIIAFTDFHGNPASVLLDGHGWPWDKNAATTGTDDDTQGTIDVEYYDESNFLTLGIPTTF